MRKLLFLISFVVCLIMVTAPSFGEPIEKSRGQTAYAPVIHNCFRWDDVDPAFCSFRGATRLIIRNIDLNHPITVIFINLYDPDGVLRHEFLAGALTIPPLASETFPIPGFIDLWDAHTDGRPSFIVRWRARREVSPPIIETGRVLIEDLDGSFDAVGLDVTPATILRERD